MPLFCPDADVHRIGKDGGAAAPGALTEHTVQRLLDNSSPLFRHIGDQHPAIRLLFVTRFQCRPDTTPARAAMAAATCAASSPTPVKVPDL